MQLIFFRHGEAEEVNAMGEDAIRSLTDKGAKRTKRMGKMLAQLIPAQCRTQIWSSPLLRARQTADILSERLAAKVKLHDAISNGDFESLRLLLDQCQKEDCVIVVGHQPFLGEWTNQLTGVNPPFRKSAAVGMRYVQAAKQQGEYDAELLWYIQPNFSKCCR